MYGAVYQSWNLGWNIMSSFEKDRARSNSLASLASPDQTSLARLNQTSPARPDQTSPGSLSETN